VSPALTFHYRTADCDGRPRRCTPAEFGHEPRVCGRYVVLGSHIARRAQPARENVRDHVPRGRVRRPSATAVRGISSRSQSAAAFLRFTTGSSLSGQHDPHGGTRGELCKGGRRPTGTRSDRDLLRTRERRSVFGQRVCIRQPSYLIDEHTVAHPGLRCRRARRPGHQRF